MAGPAFANGRLRPWACFPGTQSPLSTTRTALPEFGCLLLPTEHNVQDGRRESFHSFQSLMVFLAMSLTAARSHFPGLFLRSATTRCVARLVPRWTFAVSQAMA